MVQLNFHNEENKAIGILNWFAVHPTSMNKTNRLISGGRFYFQTFHLLSKYKAESKDKLKLFSGDNKGAASLMMEKLMSPNDLAGK